MGLLNYRSFCALVLLQTLVLKARGAPVTFSTPNTTAVTWTVSDPFCVVVKATVSGGGGGNSHPNPSNGGRGAMVTGTFSCTGATIVSAVVGSGASTVSTYASSGRICGGNGGSASAITVAGTLLIVAAGGGGGADQYDGGYGGTLDGTAAPGTTTNPGTTVGPGGDSILGAKQGCCWNGQDSGASSSPATSAGSLSGGKGGAGCGSWAPVRNTPAPPPPTHTHTQPAPPPHPTARATAPLSPPNFP